ncbi:PAS domain-containing protein [Mesorhizobium neociceri]|uniref:histidine kinase n=1 Tax=Mesorhizobium neociceri TaxID=1307853 RepID=A0A838AXU6_9HYPH|nr:PAS domain-containing protein [Mesorhizobium neociceri]MBA1138663.1 PAS domain-containing protein [Mesorhizobium neociceri]
MERPVSKDGAEAAPFSSEQELRLLVETLPTLVWQAEPGGNIEYVNKRVLDYFGAPLDEITGWGWVDRVHPDDVAFKVKNWLANLETKSPSDVVCRFRGADGRYRWFNVRGAPLKDSDGRVLRWYGVLIDVDDQKNAEEAVRESEYKLRQIFETVPGLIWLADPNGNMSYVNQRILDYISAPFEETIGSGWEAFIHPDDRPETAKVFQQAIQTVTSYEIVHRLRRSDGAYRWHHTRAEPMRDRQGNVIQWYGLSVDIDEAKRAEDRLRRSEALLAEAQRLGHSGASAANESTVLYFSEEAYRIWGFDPALGIPSPEAMFQRVHPNDRDQVRAKSERVFSDKRGYSHEYRIVLPDGTVKHIESIREPVFSPSGEVVEIVSTQIDVTERKRAEDRLRRSEAYLAEAQSLSHSGVAAYNETKILYGSEEIYRIWGVDPAQGIPSLEAVIQQVHPDDRDRMRAQVQRAVDEKRDYSIAYRIILPDGTTKHLEAIGRPAFSANGELVEIVTTQIDVTERKKAEDRLRRSEAHLAEAQRLSHIGATAANKSKVLYFSEEAYRIWGLDPTLGIPTFESMAERLHPDDRDRVLARVQLAFTEKRGYSHKYRILLPDGTVKHIESIGEPVLSASGDLFEVVATQIDVTERKRAEEALRESEHRLRQIFETVPGLLWSTDPAGEPTQLNQRFLDYTGLRFEDFKHGGWEAFLHPDDLSEAAKAFYHAIQTGTSFQAVSRLRRADGEFRWHHTRGEPLRNRQGHIVQWYGLSVDIDEAKKAEDRLRRSEAYLAEAQRLSHSGVSAYNETAILYGSEETYRIWGFDPAKGVPTREAVFKRVHPLDVERLNAVVQRAVSEKRGYEIGYRIVLPDGRIKHLETIGHPMFSASGELVEIVTTQLDVTERKRAEEGMRESQEKFRDYAESASDWFWEIGPDYKFTLLTENAFGSDSTDRIGTACWDGALDLETDPEKWRLLQETLDSRKPFRDFVYHSARRIGSPIHVKATGKPVFDADGEFLGYRGTGTDVTAIMSAQEALRESERRARSALDGIAGLITVNDSDGKLETVNRQVLEYFGRPLEWLKNWGTNDVIHPEDLPRILEIYKRATASGTPFNYELRLRRFNGEYRWFDNRGVPIRDDSGRVVRWYVLLTDIEDRKRTLQRLEQLQSDFAHMNRVSLMGELAASLSHEITQPIAAARNNARAAMHFLDRKSPDLAEIGEALASIVDDADRAGDIIDRIRDHIKKAPPRKSRFDLNEAIEEVIGLAQGAITTNGVSARTQLTEVLAYVEGDRVQLQQVVLNLILNAVEAMSTVEPGRREILISTEQIQTGGVLVSVRDSGPGIDPDHLDHVFQAFYTTKPNGVGMGLSISRSIIDAHGGRLWADVNASRGAAFRFSLPGSGGEVTNSRRSAGRTG